MAWAIVVSTVLVLLVFSRGFRIVALGLVALLIAAYAIIELDDQRDEHLARSRIPVSQLVFDNVALEPQEYAGGHSYKLSGRVKNNSQKYTLNEVTLVATMRDCPTEAQLSDSLRLANSVGNYDEARQIAEKIKQRQRFEALSRADAEGNSDEAIRQAELIQQAIDAGAPLDEGYCVAIGEKTVNIYADVPPGQARGFNESVSFEGALAPKGQLTWGYVVSETSGQ
jgi:hypothetical protein